MNYRIKELREAKKYSQETLSKKSNVSRAILSRLETGKTDVTTTTTLEKIAAALEVPVREIFLP